MAILLVLGRHVLFIPERHSLAIDLARRWREFGWIGVDLFFVLSGFLVSGLLFREFQATGSIAPGRFLARRGLKIYPAFYFFLVMATLAIYVGGGVPVPRRQLLGEIFYLQNYVGGLWPQTWSLAIEEHFYLILTALVFALSLKKNLNDPFRAIPAIFLGVAAAALGCRMYLAYVSRRPWNDILFPTHCRIDSLFFGVLLGYFFHLRREPTTGAIKRFRLLIALASVACLLPVVTANMRNTFVLSAGLSLLYLGFGGIMMLMIVHEKTLERMFRRLPVVRTIGRHSYSIYLWHVAALKGTLVLVGLIGFQRNNFYLALPMYVALSIGAGMLFSVIIEQPVLLLRNRRLPSRCGNLEMTPEPLN